MKMKGHGEELKGHGLDVQGGCLAARTASRKTGKGSGRAESCNARVYLGIKLPKGLNARKQGNTLSMNVFHNVLCLDARYRA